MKTTVSMSFQRETHVGYLLGFIPDPNQVFLLEKTTDTKIFNASLQ